MATIDASLKLFDSLHEKLNKTTEAMEKVMQTVGKIKQGLGTTLIWQVDTMTALLQLERVRELLRVIALPATSKVTPPSAVQIKANLDLQQVNRELTRLRTSLPTLLLRLDTGSWLVQILQLRARIQSQMGIIIARIHLQLTGSFTAMFVNLQRLVNQLVMSMRGLQINSGSSAMLTGLVRRITKLERQVADLFHAAGAGGSGGGGSGGSEDAPASPPAGPFSKLKSLAAQYVNFEQAAELYKKTINAGMDQQKIKDLFIARSQNEAVGTALFEKYRKYAVENGLNVNDTLNATLSFMPISKKESNLQGFTQIAERLTLFDSTNSGWSGASSALKAAYSGDTSLLSKNYGLSKEAIQSSKLADYSKQGDTSGFIAEFDKLLETQRMGKQPFKQVLESPLNQVITFKDNVANATANAGMASMDVLRPMLVELNTMFQAGSFQPFFTALQAGVTLVTMALAGLIDGALWFWKVVEGNWPVVQAILAGIGAFILMSIIPSIGAMIVELWAMIPPLMLQLGAWLMINWPILLIAAAIGVLVYVLQYFGVTTEQVIGFVAGVFGLLYAEIYNKIAAIWNTLASFVEFMVNVFIDPVYAIKKLFYDLTMNFMTMLENMALSAEDFAGSFMTSIVSGVNYALQAINKLIEGMNKTAKTNFPTIELFDVKNKHIVSEGIGKIKRNINKPTSEMDVVNLKRMDYMSYKDSYTSASQLGVNGFNKLKNIVLPPTSSDDLANKWAPPSPGEDKNINRVGEVGKINESVEISSEDLKTMRELAELKNIQNFVSLTPTVSVQTGDIHSGYDIDTIISRIERSLEEEIASSAKGVYGFG